jgi:hypothetical protein
VEKRDRPGDETDEEVLLLDDGTVGVFRRIPPDLRPTWPGDLKHQA